MSDYSMLPRYRCHKVVRAARIVAVHYGFDEPPFGAFSVLVSIDGQNVRVAVPPDLFARKAPAEGEDAYLVVYDDGFVSWSPAKAFEEGYALLVNAIEPEMPAEEVRYAEHPRHQAAREDIQLRMTCLQMAGAGREGWAVEKVTQEAQKLYLFAKGNT